MDKNDLIRQALALHEQGDAAGALKLYEQYCQSDTDDPDVWRLRGGALSQLGREEEAVTFFAQSVECALRCGGQDDKMAVNFFRKDWADSLSRLGRLQQAAEVYGQILAIEPGNAGACFGMGRLLEKGRDYAGAVTYYRRACGGTAEDISALLGLGGCHWKMLRGTEALEAFDTVIGYDPACAQAWLGRALCVQNSDRQQARQDIEKALKLVPGYAQALDAMAFVLLKEGRLADALEFSARALQADCGDGDILCTAAMIQRELGEAEAACRMFEQAGPIVGSHPKYFDSLLLTLQYTSLLSPQQMFNLHRQWAEQFEILVEPENRCRPIEREAEADLRIGFVSGDFCSHPVSFFLEPLLKPLMDLDCEIVLYSNTAGEDGTTARLKQSGACWRDLTGMNDRAAADLIAQDGVDVLIDLSGHTPGNRLGIFPYRPARVQCSWLGYPDTTGTASIDYRIVDVLTDPPGSEALCSEKLLYTKDCFLCYRFPRGYTPPPPRKKAEGEPFVFGCFNNPAKYSPQCLNVWAQILKACPDSLLMLKASGLGDELTRRYWLDKFAGLGIGSERLQLLGRTPGLQEHFDLYGKVDVALDTFPYNGTTTTFEALSCGVPVVTLSGARHACRVGLSIMSFSGHKNFVTGSEEEYAQLATMFTHTPKELFVEKISLYATLNPENGESDALENWCIDFKSLLISVL